MRRHFLRLCVLAGIVGLAACGSNPSGPSVSGGVTVNGSIVAPGSGTSGTASSGPSTASVPPGLTVSVTGTAISAGVPASGQFQLRNVPPGQANLQFSAPGVSASVGLSDLQTGQTVDITVSLDGSTATLESLRRSLGPETQLEGKVEAIPPTTPAGTFTVAGRTVTTDANTQFILRNGPVAFSALQVGFRVHVKGEASGTSLLARIVDIQNTSGSNVNLSGEVANFSGTSAAFQFEINGTVVKGDALTEFFGNSSFAMLVNGAQVEVKGLQQSGFVYASRIHVETQDVEFVGVIVAPITGTSPALQFLVDSTTDRTVITDADTVVKRGGDEQTPAQLQVGMTVSVTGRLLASGTVIAKRVHIEGDAVGGLFEMSGSIGGLGGTCPVVTFSVSGYQIATTATTTYVPAAPGCSSLSNGTKVTVKGIVQAGGSVKATEVKKQ